MINHFRAPYFTVVRRLLLALLLACALPAYSELSLDAAKAQGLVGEDASGYLAATSNNPSSDVKQLIQKVNVGRSAQYRQIAQRNQITVSDVELLAGQKAIDRTQPGHYIRLSGGSWQRK